MTSPITNKPTFGVSKWANITAGPVTLAVNDFDQIVYTGGVGTITLPLAASSINGAKISFKNMGTGALTVAANGTENIWATAAAPAGVASITVAADTNTTLVADALHARWIKTA